MQIIKPNEKYIESYYKGCLETWDNVHDRYIIHNPKLYNEWKSHIIQDFIDAELGKNLPEGFLPNSTYWLVSDDEYIGTINLRYKLNDNLKRYGGHIGIVIRPKFRGGIYANKMMSFGFEKLQQKNISPIIITTQETNKLAIKGLKYLKPIKFEKDTININNNQLQIRRYYFN